MASAEQDVAASNPVCDIGCVITCVVDLGNWLNGTAWEGKLPT